MSILSTLNTYSAFAGSNDSSEWIRVLGDRWSWGSGPEDEFVHEYEGLFASRLGADHAISFGSGRMALYAILDALDIGEGDEVIVPAFTCVVVVNAILYRGARPIYVDVDPKTFNIDVSKVEAAITPRTRALYAQHTFGVPCRLDELQPLARHNQLPIIEDGAHALGALIAGKPVGSGSDVAFFSTDHSKIISTQLGGMATTTDERIASRLRRVQADTEFLPVRTVRKILDTFLLEYVCTRPPVHLGGKRVHGILCRLGRCFYFEDEMSVSRPLDYPYPCRLAPPLARLGISQLEALSDNLAHRRSIAAWLEEQVGWYGFSEDEIQSYAWLRYAFLVRDRKEFWKRFDRKFWIGSWFTSVVGGRNEDLGAVMYKHGSCPVAERVARHIVNLPTHPGVPNAAIQGTVRRHLPWLRGQILDV